MGKILNIGDHLSSIENQGIKITFCQGVKPLPQHGQVCKLIAGLSVQNYLFASNRHSTQPLPLHKRHFFNESLRQRAKQQINSQVGEVYGADQMSKVFNYNNFETHSYRITDKFVYEEFIISSLNQAQPVIAYFDVTPRLENSSAGDPDNFNGRFEHATAIVGYYYLDNKLHLIASQWDDYYDLLIDKLFESTSQLSSTKQPEHYQKYYPIPGFFDKSTWLELEQMNQMLDFICNNENSITRSLYSFLNYIWPISGDRQTNPPQGATTSLANVLTIIQGDLKKAFFEEFQDCRIDCNEKSELIADYSYINI